jgi:transposase
MMTKILVYGYCVGVFSSRRLQKRLHEDIAFRMLAADNQPDFALYRIFARFTWCRCKDCLNRCYGWLWSWVR